MSTGGDVSFEEAFAASGAKKRSADVPETMPEEYIRERCETIERVLKLQFMPDPLPPRFQRELERCSGDSLDVLVERWHTLSHLLRCVRDDLSSWGEGASDSVGPDAEEAARQLMQREPVQVDLGDRTVEVTGRSYAAMLAMARHESRMEELKKDLDRIEDLREEAADNRSRHQRLGRIQRIALQELRLHRKALYAHAFTDDGAPAASFEEAPDWWDEVGPAWDAVLLMALFEAGPGRIQRLGPVDDDGSSGKKSDDWGYKSLLASLERQNRAEPASYFNRDLGQLIAWVRGGAPPEPDLD